MAYRKIKLYGKLGTLFGKEWNLDVNSVSEAIRAIDINTKGELSKYLLKNKSYYKVAVKNKKNLVEKEELLGSFGGGDIYITPVIKGSGKYGKIIAGVVLIVAAYYMGGFGAGAGSGSAGSTAMWGSYIGQAGIALALGGVAELLMTSKGESEDQRNSYLFQGNSTTVYQGTSVGLAYGRVLVSPMPVCISSSARDINTYEGGVVAVGEVGTVTEILYSYRQGIATLCGFNEFVASTPPKKYLMLNRSGTIYRTRYNICHYPYTHCVWGFIHSGKKSYDRNTLICSGHTEYYTEPISGDFSCPDCLDGGVWPPSNSCDCSREWWECTIGADDYTYTPTKATGFPTNSDWRGKVITEISDEYTESDAINRLLPKLSWSPWQTTPIYPYKEQRTTGFSFLYREVKTKTNTYNKFNPNLYYTYSVTYERRLSGSSDPWADAELIDGLTKPDSGGDIILPDTPNVDGYDTRVKQAIIALATG